MNIFADGTPVPPEPADDDPWGEGATVHDIKQARGKRAAAPKQVHPFFDKTSLLAQQLADFIHQQQPTALTAEGHVALYLGGVYHIDPTTLTSAVVSALGDQHRPGHLATVEQVLVGNRAAEGRRLLDRPTDLLNVENGMLKPSDGTLYPHHPDYLSFTQLPVPWEPGATCPNYDAWLADQIPEQADELEEIAATMLDPEHTPELVLFAYGPSRSGKSTFLRIMREIAGHENTSAVTLHQLSVDPFASANLYGKTLNVAADLSHKHVEDLSVWKTLTGRDPVQANRKYGAQFTFTNRALFAFSANELPTVSDSSDAYVNRVRPFKFGRSFAGREDPTIEDRLLAELPGILCRWVAALQRLRERGHHLGAPEAVQTEFETRSDRVRQWVEECCEIHPANPGKLVEKWSITTKQELSREFNRWADISKAPAMGPRKIVDRLMKLVSVVEVRHAETKARGLNITVRPDAEWGEAQ